MQLLTISEAIVNFLSLKLAEAFHFKRIDLLPATLLLFSQHGYNCWTSRDGGGIAETSESDWDAIGVPRGEQQKLKHSLEVYHKDFNAYNQFLVGNFSKFEKKGVLGHKFLFTKNCRNLDMKLVHKSLTHRLAPYGNLNTDR